MKEQHSAERLDVEAFARAGARLQGRDDPARYPRLAAEMTEAPDAARIEPMAPVCWQADGELREPAGAPPQVWLTLAVDAELTLVCQRCLQPLRQPLRVRGRFRFAPDEASAAAIDEISDDADVLVASRGFDLHGLIEDELLMALPIVPRHDACPAPLTPPQPADGPAHPFAALAALRRN